MKTLLQNCDKFDCKLEPSDWRFSAAILGLMEYFSYIDPSNNFHQIKSECILYNRKIINKSDFLSFVEIKYDKELHHRHVEDLLYYYNDNDNQEINSEKIELINHKLSINQIMKKVFSKTKFNGYNKSEILDLIEINREDIIYETFKSKKDMYSNFCNMHQLFKDDQNYCRLLGYYIDGNKKSKSIGYNFNANSFTGEDIQEFDFIPFAFINDRESIFINNSYDLRRLLNTKKELETQIKTDSQSNTQYRTILYSLSKLSIENSEYIDNNLEIIIKNKDKNHFETLYLRKSSIHILKAIVKNTIDYKSLFFSLKITEDYYINIYHRVINCILNNILLDEIIDLLIRDSKNYYRVNQLLKINELIRSEAMMSTNKIIDEKTKNKVHACAKAVRDNIQDNKLESYRNYQGL